MPSAKQIKARKAFARKYAKKGKRKAKSKKPKSFKIDKKTGSVSSPMMDKKYKAEFKKSLERRLLKARAEGIDGRPLTSKEMIMNKEILDQIDVNWDKKMQEFLNRTNNEP